MVNLIDTPEKPDASEPFAKMAARIAHNADEKFGGAFVVVSPDGSVIELLMLDNAQSPAMFWSNLKTTAEMAIGEIEEKQRLAQGYGYR